MINLFIFAHQDDEFGVFPEIQRIIARKERILAVYLTSGDLTGVVSETRNKESIDVLTTLGVAKQDVFFLGADCSIPDGQLSVFAEIVYKKLTAFCRQFEISRLYCLAYEGGHRDHDAAHIISVALANQLNIIDHSFQFSLYNRNKPILGLFYHVLSPIFENGPVISYNIPIMQSIKYIGLCFKYRSQKIIWLGLFPFFLIHCLFYRTQALQKVSLTRINERPHQGKLFYERSGLYLYDDFVHDINVLKTLNKG